jgi:hypothetical protein
VTTDGLADEAQPGAANWRSVATSADLQRKAKGHSHSEACAANHIVSYLVK